MDAMKDTIRDRYGAAAAQARAGVKPGCGCGTTPSCGTDPITSDLYPDEDAGDVPAAAVRASLGCGNPTAAAELQPGEVVLDLGSGGGIDVLLSARRVGPAGKVYGLDVTDEMLALARENQRTSRLSNVEFLRGDIEQIPLPDNSVDVIISNCVINLSSDKDRVLSEAFRVLKPGGRFAVADVVVRGAGVPEEIRGSMELWTGCVAGALKEESYRDKLTNAGFEKVDVEPWRIYRTADMQHFLADAGLTDQSVLDGIDGRLMSAFVRARKPVRVASACCTPSCCTEAAAR